MIPFGVKILWFVLSITGLVSSWLVLIPFGRAVGAIWAPVTFCVGNTLLQGIFCLGMIWRMNPFLMPRGFCIAQTLIIGFATFLLTGTAGAFSMATSLAVLRPKKWGGNTALRWRNIFLIPVVLFPVAATVVHTVIVVKFSSVKPTDDLHCDSSDPEWVRFLGYTGVPFIVSLPCTFFSVKSLMRIWKANQGIQRKNRSIVFESVGNYTSLPPRSFKNGSVNILFKEPDPDSGAFGYQPSLARATPMSGITSTQSFVTANEYPPSPNTTSSTPAPFLLASQPASPVERKFHLPFRPSLASPGVPPMDSLVEDYRRAAPKEGREEDSSDVSSTLPVFASSETSTKHTIMQNAGRDAMRSVREKSNGGESDVSEIVWAHQSVDNNGPRAVVSRTSMRDDASGVLGETMSGRQYMTPMARISQPSLLEESAARSLPNLAPAIWRIILFQTAFCAVQVLTCISTIIDLATHRPTPTPLGTQHFALLLAAWGPAIVFGHSPAVRNSLRFWRRGSFPP